MPASAAAASSFRAARSAPARSGRHRASSAPVRLSASQGCTTATRIASIGATCEQRCRPSLPATSRRISGSAVRGRSMRSSGAITSASPSITADAVLVAATAGQSRAASRDRARRPWRVMAMCGRRARPARGSAASARDRPCRGRAGACRAPETSAPPHMPCATTPWKRVDAANWIDVLRVGIAREDRDQLDVLLRERAPRCRRCRRRRASSEWCGCAGCGGRLGSRLIAWLLARLLSCLFFRGPRIAKLEPVPATLPRLRGKVPKADGGAPKARRAPSSGAAHHQRIRIHRGEDATQATLPTISSEHRAAPVRAQHHQVGIVCLGRTVAPAAPDRRARPRAPRRRRIRPRAGSAAFRRSCARSAPAPALRRVHQSQHRHVETMQHGDSSRREQRAGTPQRAMHGLEKSLATSRWR